MTIRRRLILAFLSILVLFAINEAIQLWSAHLLTTTMATLSRTLTRQVIVASFQKRVDDLQKQVSLMSQIEPGGEAPEARRLVNEELNLAAADIQQLKTFSDLREITAVQELERTYGELAEAWRRFYDYFGVEQAWALAYQVRSEPLSRRVLNETLPKLQQEQGQRVQDAKAEFASVGRLTNRVSIGIFGISMILAITIASRVARSLVAGLSELNLGAAVIGTMNLDHRISIATKDEIGTLARAFNNMAENLAHARGQLMTANDELASRNTDLKQQREVSDSLLRNILPEQIAAELASEGKVQPRYFEDVTIIFTDFVGFTLSTEELPAEDLVEILGEYFTAFDRIVARYGLEKLKTIGDSYFCVGGLPVRTPSHPVDAVLAAFEIVQAVIDRASAHDRVRWAVRVGIHTGPVVAGVVGIKKFAFDIWGDAVNYASRLESAGAPNRINVSLAVYRRVKDFFAVESRGLVATKENKEFEMYFIDGLLPSFLDGSGVAPPAAFLQRYRAYFQKDLPAFPAFLIGSDPLRQRPTRLDSLSGTSGC